VEPRPFSVRNQADTHTVAKLVISPSFIAREMTLKKVRVEGT